MADKRYKGKEEEQKKSKLGSLLKTGATIGGGVAIYKNRHAIAHAAKVATSEASLLGSRVLSQNGVLSQRMGSTHVLFKGLTDALGDNPSLRRTIRAGWDKNIQRKFANDFNKSVQNSADRIKDAQKSNKPGLMTPTKNAHHAYKRFHKRKANGLSKQEYAATIAFRENKINEILGGRELIKEKGGDFILQALADFNRRERIYDDPLNHTKEFIEKLKDGTYSKTVTFKDKKEESDFRSLLEETISKYSDTKKTFHANKEVIKQKADSMETAEMYGFIKNMLSEKSFFADSLSRKGFDAITLKDAEKMDKATRRKYQLVIDDVDGKGNPIEVDMVENLQQLLAKHKGNKELQSLLEKKNINFDFDNMVLDLNLRIHRETGEILDNRHIRDGITKVLDTFQDSTQIPFLKINPLDLTPRHTLASGKRKEGLEVLRTGQVHGYVRNISDQTFDGSPRAEQGNAIRGGMKNSDFFYTDGNVFKHTKDGGLELVDENLYMVSSQYGPFAKMHKNQTGYTANEKADKRGGLRKFFDVGYQEGESRFTTYKKAWEKLSKDEYGPNAMRSLLHKLHVDDHEDQADVIRNVYGILRKGIDTHTTAMSREAAEVLAPKINRLFKDIEVNGQAFDFSRISDDDYLINASLSIFRELNQDSSNLMLYNKHVRSVYNQDGTKRANTGLVEDSSVTQLKSWVEKYIHDPEKTLNERTALPPTTLPSPIDFITDHLGGEDHLLPAIEKWRKSFHQYALRVLDDNAGDLTSNVIEGGIRKRSSIRYLEEAAMMGKIGDADLKNAKDLEVLTDLLSYQDIYEKPSQFAEAKTFLEDIMSIPTSSATHDGSALMFESASAMYTNFGLEIQEAIKRAQPVLGRAPEAKAAAANGADFVLMRKGGVIDAVKRHLGNINLNIMKEGPIDDGWDVAINAERITRRAAPRLWDATVDVTKELFAGRHRKGDNLEDVTTTTAIIYGLAERMDNQFTNLGLGLSSKNMGSFQSIIGNQYFRRIALPYMAYQQAMYFDGLTGDVLSDTAADAYVNTHETVQQMKDMLQINKAMKPWANVFKQAGGFDQVGEWMGVKQLDFLTFGLFSDFRSAEEVREYYESGEDPIRKNRYWSIGSPSPWAGGGIDHFEANWYRKLKSDYKFTDTMYGSEKEYWANHWMPTLTNPLAPIKHFLLDPYHYEKKHEEDRPYAITGGFSEIQNIPLVGSLLDGTVGRILKPRKEHEGLEKAHKEYISAINSYIQEQYSTAHDGSLVTVSGTGAVESYNAYANQGTDEYFGGTAPVYGANAGLVNSGNGITPVYNNANQAAGGYGEEFGYGSYGSYGGAGTLAEGISAAAARQLLAEQNYALAQQGKGVTAETTYGLHKLRNKGIPQDIDSMEQLDSMKGMLLDGFYSASELAGIYGFSTKTGLGYEESWRGTTLAPSTLMTSYSRAFWDMNLGGAGGSLSEIGRRYVPRDPNKDYYSPIRNLMPNWLPGIEGSVDYLHGDPFSKIAKGEIRLPGAAYESLYKLHPDGTGTGDFANYGVFDRFRILADIDPDSEQYKSAKHQVSLLRQAGGMTEDMEKEYNEIIDQVKAKEDTYRWYDKKFTNAKIKTETVTISKVIDANTFMVKEHDAPIKLAGVKLTEKDNGDAIEWLSQFLKPGEKVKIGIAEEAAERYNQDTYGTMSAVVYANKNEKGRMGVESIKGQSLNAILANREWQNAVQIKDSGKAVDTRALYSNDMVTVGKWMEFVTHDVLPKVPFVGIFADKFLQVRTPIESYKRDQVYGTDWRPWQQPYEGWIKPMINTVASQNPLIAGAEMAAIGHMFAKGKRNAGLGRILGFAIGSGLASARVFKEGAEDLIPGTDGLWLPKERRTEREINEYFDRLKYVKYRGLYEQAKKLAEQKEGVNVDEFFHSVDEKARSNKSLKRFLTDRKKTLSFHKKIGYGDTEAVESQIDDLSNGLEDITEAKEAYVAGKYTSLAIRYRKEYEGTLYALGEHGAADRTALMRALTPKEREYVPRFLETTSSRERHEILKYVPKDIKRILQGSWGMKVDKAEDINEYFDDHYLPNANWEGWNAAVNLDDIKIKVMQKEGLNPTVSGYWGKDQARAEQSGAKAIPIHSLSSKLDPARLKDVLKGAGLSDVDVQLTKSYGEGPGGINTSINIMQDIKGEFLSAINEGVHSLF